MLAAAASCDERHFSSASNLDAFLQHLKQQHPSILQKQPPSAASLAQIVCTIDANQFPPGAPIPPTTGIITFYVELLPTDIPFIIGSGYLHISKIVTDKGESHYDARTDQTELRGDEPLFERLLLLCESLSSEETVDFLSRAFLRERKRWFEQQDPISDALLHKHLEPVFLVENQYKVHGCETPLYSGVISTFLGRRLTIVDQVNVITDGSNMPLSTPNKTTFTGVYFEVGGTFSLRDSRVTYLPEVLYRQADYRVDARNVAHLEQVQDAEFIDGHLTTANTLTCYYPARPAYFEKNRVWSQHIQGAFERAGLKHDETYTITTRLTNGGTHLLHHHPEKGYILITSLNPEKPHEFTLYGGRFRVDLDPYVRLRRTVYRELTFKLSNRSDPNQPNKNCMLLEIGTFNAEQCLHTLRSGSSSRAEYSVNLCTAAHLFEALTGSGTRYDVDAVKTYMATLQSRRLSWISGNFVNGNIQGNAQSIYVEIQEGQHADVHVEATYQFGKKQGSGVIVKQRHLETPETQPLHYRTMIVERCTFQDDHEISVEEEISLELWRTPCKKTTYIRELWCREGQLFLRHDREENITIVVGEYSRLLRLLRDCEEQLKSGYSNLQGLTIGRTRKYAKMSDFQRAEKKEAAAAAVPEDGVDDEITDDEKLMRDRCAVAARTKDMIAQQVSRYNNLHQAFQSQQVTYKDQGSRYGALRNASFNLGKKTLQTMHQKLRGLFEAVKQEKRQGELLLQRANSDLTQCPTIKSSGERMAILKATQQRLDEVGRVSSLLNDFYRKIDSCLETLNASLCKAPEPKKRQAPVATSVTEVPQSVVSTMVSQVETPVQKSPYVPLPLPEEVRKQVSELNAYYKARRDAGDQGAWQKKVDDLAILVDNATYEDDVESRSAAIHAIKKKWTLFCGSASTQGMFAIRADRPLPRGAGTIIMKIF